MKTKRNYTESLKLSTNEFELFDNTHENIMNFFKQDEELFDSAVETGKDAYGEGGGYRENDKYVVIDKEHPFGTALYSTSDEEVVNVLKREYYNKVEESKDIEENSEFFIGDEGDIDAEIFAVDNDISDYDLQWDNYRKGYVLTWKNSTIEENIVKEGGSDSGNFKSGAQRYNDKKDKIFSRYNAQQERFAKFLLDHDVPAKEVEKLKQDSGLNGNPLAQKYFELKKQLEEKVVEPELPTEVTIDGELLVDDVDDIGEAYLDEVISDWLSDNYGFLHLGFDYDVVGTDVHVTNILWDTSDEDSLEESIKLNEGTGNFRTNDIINLCSPEISSGDYSDYADELREEEPDITDDEIEERIADIVDNEYTDMFKRVEHSLSDVDEYVTVEAGYYEGFYIDFKFDNGTELAENWFNYDKDYAISEFKAAVEKIKQGLKESVEEGNLVGYAVAYRFSNGETGYHLEKDIEKTIKSIDDALNKVLDEGLKAIDEEFIDEIE